ncbi:Candidapepsin-1 [Orbilia brochopaga]|nr:Candidapepsin-1 [Drechslerella brochopaga]
MSPPRRTRAAGLASTLLFLSSAWPSLASAVETAPKVVSMPFARRHDALTLERIKMKRNAGSIDVALGNGQQDASSIGIYYVNTTIGTPGQMIQVQLDTGSSDLWMFSDQACSRDDPCYGGTFDPSASSTYQLQFKDEFNISYVTAGSGVHGDYILDDVNLAGVTVKGLTMGLATEAKNVPTGIMGIGYRQNEAIFAQTGGRSSYPNIVELMVNQSLINSRAYSLFLDDKDSATGTILFGGYDTAKFDGDLSLLDIQPDQNGIISGFIVAWTNFSITTEQNGEVGLVNDGFDLPVFLDSGTTLTYLPEQLAEQILEAADAVYDRGSDIYYVQCDLGQSSATLNYQFGGRNGPTIKVPFSELVLSANAVRVRGVDYCVFGIKPAASGDILLFGDTFLRSAYVVYNLDGQTIGIAQANNAATDSKIVEVGAGGSMAERVASVSDQPKATVTATSRAGDIGGLGTLSPNTGLATLTQTATPQFTFGGGSTSTSTRSGNAAAGTVPAIDWSAVTVIVGSVALAVCGGGLFIVF